MPPRVTRRRLGRPSRTPDERLYAGEQFLERERLGEVVVAARLQTLDAIVNRSAGAEDEHRRADGVPPHLVDERQAVALREHEVDDRDVVDLPARAIERGVAVAGHVDR